MTAAATTIERSGPVIREVLAQHSPDECAVFEVEFQQAAHRVAQTFDVAPLEALIDRWWGIAALRANELSDAERAQVARARRGDESGWIVHLGDGRRRRL